MYRKNKDSIVFYQRKEIRKISFYEILMACFGIYGLIIVYKNGIHSSGLFYLGISTIVIIARFIAPMFQKQYNARITNNEVILDNLDLHSIRFTINSINEYKAINSSTISLSGESKGENYQYNILLDDADISVFLEAIDLKKKEYLNSIRETIHRSVNNKN